MQPRYPRARVLLHSHHPLVLIAAVRTALREAGASREDIEAFSNSAFATRDPATLERVCREWALVEAPRVDSVDWSAVDWPRLRGPLGTHER